PPAPARATPRPGTPGRRSSAPAPRRPPCRPRAAAAPWRSGPPAGSRRRAWWRGRGTPPRRVRTPGTGPGRRSRAGRCPCAAPGTPRRWWCGRASRLVLLIAFGDGEPRGHDDVGADGRLPGDGDEGAEAAAALCPDDDLVAREDRTQ